MSGESPSQILSLLEVCRQKERDQTTFYRSLSVLAESVGDEVLSERFNALLADEQHHLSRLTARILELGGTPGGFGEAASSPDSLEGWEDVARLREQEEVSRYEELLTVELDPVSMELFREILESEQRHAQELGGKWMSA